ncbi:MAG: geranylgeranyl reductase family protein [Candidatus Aenigmarchaeota archaeon]|nr:geranylgeranyl reductase family protein [Candidatus Aenigmarchaeota archaeon]
MQGYDVIIIGAGPAGATAAMYLHKAGKNVLLLDKAKFPRDKTCGDAQGRKAARILKELGIYEGYANLDGHVVYGLTLSSPNGTQVELDVEHRNNPPPGYVHKRIVFDHYLYQCASGMVQSRTFEVTDVIQEAGHVVGVKGKNEAGKEEEIRAKMVLAADGAISVVARKFGLTKNPPEHYIAAVRAYYTGVEGMTDRIEIHMVKSLIPGYFWIFPLPNKEANVGLGMIIKDMNDKRVNLKEALVREIKDNPLFAGRFQHAKMASEVKGWNLPIASYRRKCYGNGYLLLGDAASLIDPLSGEGVGNAMISGRVAAMVAAEALAKNDFSEKLLQRYDGLLWDEIGPEIQANYRLQKLGKRFPSLIDKVLEKASKDDKFRLTFEKMLPYTGGREQIGKSNFLKDQLGFAAPEEI